MQVARQFAQPGTDARFAGFCALFNRQQYYEAHDLLEDLWLPDRRGPNSNFYKGLIQLAGAFVHLQKDRLSPAAALLALARKNLEPFPPVHEKLNLAAVRELIAGWQGDLESSRLQTNPLPHRAPAQICLLSDG